MINQQTKNEVCDPWTFTDTIKVYNWENHPDWNLYPLNPKADWFEQLRYYDANRKSMYMIQCKRIIANYGCLGWDDIAKRNTFNSSESWQKNKFYPIKLSNNAQNLYYLDFPYPQPILTRSVNMPPNKRNINIHGVWKIYYSGGSDTGSIYVDSLDIFKFITYVLKLEYI